MNFTELDIMAPSKTFPGALSPSPGAVALATGAPVAPKQLAPRILPDGAEEIDGRCRLPQPCKLLASPWVSSHGFWKHIYIYICIYNWKHPAKSPMVQLRSNRSC